MVANQPTSITNVAVRIVELAIAPMKLEGDSSVDGNEGYQAHMQHLKRTDNPYMRMAMLWDQGWVKRQREELTAGGKDPTKCSNFKDWIGDRIRTSPYDSAF